jgi:transcription termination/antitermination protein NusG
MPITKSRKSQTDSNSADQDQEDFVFLDSVKPRWYIVQTYVGFEDAAKKLLEQKIENLELQNKILEIFIPTKKVLKLNVKGKRQEKVEKVYPGYIYIHMILDREIGYVLQNTNYISRIASTGNVAVPLETGYVEQLKQKLFNESNAGKISPSNIKFTIGDMVTVIEGPFKEMSGKISSLDPINSRVSVVLSIFDRDTEVILDVLEIEKKL